MGEYDFTYDIPENLLQGFIKFLELNNKRELAQHLKGCNLYHENLGFAYYAGMSGDNWNKKALDFTIEGSEGAINKIKPCEKIIKDMLQKYLKPTISGYLVRKFSYIVNETDIEMGTGITLPEKAGDDFETLSRDIHDALAKDEPVLVLDRLHTFSMKYFRGICQTHGLQVSTPDGQLYPLHSLVGNLAKYYEQNNVFISDFSKMAMKMSISLFDRYNAIRNDKSFAHDNELLDKKEAVYVVKILTDTLAFINKIENG